MQKTVTVKWQSVGRRTGTQNSISALKALAACRHLAGKVKKAVVSINAEHQNEQEDADEQNATVAWAAMCENSAEEDILLRIVRRG